MRHQCSRLHQGDETKGLEADNYPVRLFRVIHPDSIHCLLFINTMIKNATYSTPKAIRFLAIAFAAVIFIFGTTLYSFDSHTIGPVPSSLKFGFVMQVIAWICGLLGLLLEGVLIWQLIF